MAAAVALVTVGLSLVSALVPQAALPSRNAALARTSSPLVCSADGPASRRAALFSVAAAAAAVPSVVVADSVEDIAARANAAAVAARAAKEKEADVPRDETDPATYVIGALVGSVALSLPFYWKNVARLGIKLSGGGDGYDKIK